MATRTEWAERSGRSSKWITPLRRLALYLRDGFRCAYCGRDLTGAPPREVTLDHYKPRVRGGSHRSRNLITACASCNFSRQNRPVWQFALPQVRERITRQRRRQPAWALARAILRGDSPHPSLEV